MKVSKLETELPTFVPTHKAVLKPCGGELGSLYDSPKWERLHHNSRYASHSCKKDKKSYRPWRRVGSAIKSMTV